MSNYNCLTMMILRKCRANYEELTSLINKSFITPSVPFAERWFIMMSNLGAAAAAAVILYVVYRIADRYADTF